jgi:hypothetical protein
MKKYSNDSFFGLKSADLFKKKKIEKDIRTYIISAEKCKSKKSGFKHLSFSQIFMQ